MTRPEKFGEFLVSRQVMTKDDLQKLLNMQKAIPEKVGQLAVREGFLGEDECLKHFSDFTGIPVFRPGEHLHNPETSKLIPEKMARKAGILPAGRKDGGDLVLLCNGPVQQSLMHNFSRLAKSRVRLELVTEKHLKKLQQQVYTRGFDTRIDSLLRNIDGEDLGAVIELIEKIVLRALNAGNVSDIHFEPGHNDLLVRFREDGMLRRIESLPRSMATKIISRIKVLSGLDIAERRTPQDGSFAFRPTKLDVEIEPSNMRVSILPVIHGEKAVIRILPPHDEPISLEHTGMTGKTLELFKSQLASPHGLILVTGPTGSGKSTTLYGALQMLRSESTNITTLEDPVELTISGINQTHIEGSEKISFASALRAILRQDPDIIMVGEIRDPDTLQVSLRAAITGHLVLSTLHTNDAPSAFPRLVDMGGEPFLVAASARIIAAQRLVRLSCPGCRVPVPVTRAELRMLGADGQMKEGSFEVMRGKGCDLCRNKGYSGRMGIFETLVVSDALRELVMNRASVPEMIKCARSDGVYRSLMEDGLEKVMAGLTTPEEIRRVTMD